MDVSLSQSVQSLIVPWLTTAMSWLSFLGAWRSYFVIVPITAGIFYFRGRIKETVAVTLVMAGDLLEPLIKYYVQRPRPSPGVVQVLANNFKSTSFPSGHALGATIFYGFIIYLALTGRIKYKKTALIVCPLLIFLIGISRIYLGVHWPSDVMAGWLIGLLWLFIFTRIYKKFIRPKEV